MTNQYEADEHSELWNDGIRVRREVLGGDSYVNGSLERTAGTESEALQTHITETVWGAVWTRPGLDRRSRSLLNIGMLVALNQHHELSVHVRGWPAERFKTKRDRRVNRPGHSLLRCACRTRSDARRPGNAQ